ncbi:MAG: HEAT repeat domain-containing protein, partial [Fidelibacterota bacterium]
WFFDQWLYRAGHPAYEVAWTWDRKQQAVALEVSQVQAEDGVTPIFRMPVEVVTTGDFGTEKFTIQVNNAEETFYLPVASRPGRVEFDPENRVLKTLTFTKRKKELLDQLANAGDLSRMRAAEWLAEYSDGKVTIALSSSLRNDPFRGVRTEAARTLGKIRTKAARDSLLANLHAEHSHVRRAAVAALGKYIGDKKVAAALEIVFRNDSSYYTQAEALKSIAKLDVPTAYDLCVEALKVPSFREVIRSSAIQGLAELKDPRGVDHALQQAVYGNSPSVRAGAIAAMAKMVHFVPDRRSEIIDTLTVRLEDPNFGIRLSAMHALSKLGDPTVIPSLEASLAREAHFRHQDTAREAIQKLRQAGTK